MSIVQVYSGESLDLLDPSPASIFLEDIVVGLSNVCRFSGQMENFYSVLEHSLLVEQMVNELDGWAAEDEVRLQALLHDATEAYIGDVSTPLKALLPDYRTVEERLWRVIADKFSLPAKLHPLVKRADEKALVTEAAAYMNEPSWIRERAETPWSMEELEEWRTEIWAGGNLRTVWVRKVRGLIGRREE